MLSCVEHENRFVTWRPGVSSAPDALAMRRLNHRIKSIIFSYISQ